MNRLLAVVLTVGATILSMSTAPAVSHAEMPSTEVQAQYVRIYCAAATAETVCSPSYIANTGSGNIFLGIDNHANGGERCRLYINGRGHTGWVEIHVNDGYHQMAANVADGVGFNVRCHRLASSGDAGIGGLVWLN